MDTDLQKLLRSSKKFSDKPSKVKKVGSREEVFEGLAERTSGGLRKGDLFQKEDGKIASIKRSEVAKQNSDKLREGLAKKRQIQKLEKESLAQA